MANIVHSKNILIEFTRTTNIPGWLKELCYRTIDEGYLSKKSLKEVCDIFISDGAAVMQEPQGIGTEQLILAKLIHTAGVNALVENSEIVFCPEGITLLCGSNGSGKSGYFRILNHIGGGFIEEPLYPNINEQNPKAMEVSLEYTVNGSGIQSYDCSCDEQEREIEPFSRITLFDSLYANEYIRECSHNTYHLRANGYFDLYYLRQNLRRLRDRVGGICKDKIPALKVHELAKLNMDVIYEEYVKALAIEFKEELKKLINRSLHVEILSVNFEKNRPSFTVRLDKPYHVNEILSEGERKCVSLALLFAEIKLREDVNPIVLDDPVNSLDNEIIQRFVNRLLELPNQIIVFTHNYWFANMLMEAKNVNVYSINSDIAQRTSSKKHLFAYKVYSHRNEKGLIVEYGQENSSFHLSIVKRCLERMPFVNADALIAADHLRHAIENLIDEKIFLNLTPCKYRGFRDNAIKWNEFSNFANVTQEMIDVLKNSYSRLSGGATHIGIAGIENPLDFDELEEIYNSLVQL